MTFYLADLISSADTQRVSLRLHICGDSIDGKRKDPLRMSDFPNHFGVWFLEIYDLANNIQNQSRPRPRMVVAQLFGNSAKCLKRNFPLVAKYRDNPQPDQILKGVHATERTASILERVIWRKKFGIIPIRKLTKREASQTADVKRAECSDYASHRSDFEKKNSLSIGAIGHASGFYDVALSPADIPLPSRLFQIWEQQQLHGRTA